MSVGAPIRVLYLDHTAQLSGGEIALARLLASVDRSAVEPVVALAEDGPLAERLKANDVETHILPLSAAVRNVRKDTLTFGALRKLQAPFLLLAYALRLAAFARRRGIQVIHTNSLKADLYGGLVGWLTRIPVVWHMRDHIDTSYLPAPAVRAVRFLARHCPAYVVANSQSTLDQLFLAGRRPAAVVPSGIDLKGQVVHDGVPPDDIALNALPTPERVWHDPVRIGLVGRIAAWKGQHVVIDAAAKVRAAGFSAHFVIAGKALFGEEEYEAQVRQQAVDLGVADCVEFLGFTKDVPALLASLDILVHASTSPEPFGQVVIEGMAESLPVIGTDGGGVREIIVHGENGLLVPMGDADAMAEAILTLLRDPDRARALGRAGYRRVVRHFTAGHTARKIERVYRDVVSRA